MRRVAVCLFTVLSFTGLGVLGLAPPVSADTPHCVGQVEFQTVNTALNNGPRDLSWVENQFGGEITTESHFSGGDLVARKYASCAWTAKDVLVEPINQPIQGGPLRAYDVCLAQTGSDWSCG